MDIATIQKRKFLNNIYKLYYSSGNKPSNAQIRREFDTYFTANRLGDPVRVEYQTIQGEPTLNPNTLNELMAVSILNLEVLYDCIFDSNNELFGIVNAVNNKLNNLKSKRKELEARIDELIFQNSNSDGYFYSYIEKFSNLKNIDLSLTSSSINVEYGNCSIPKIVTEISGAISDQQLNSSNIIYELRVDGQVVNSSSQIESFDFMFDGLNDTYWYKEVRLDEISVVTMTLDIPVTTSSPISKISSKLLTTSPVNIFLRLVPFDKSVPEKIYQKESKNDYDSFSFNVPAIQYSRINLILSKTEPDATIPSASDPYVYRIGVREFYAASEYYDVKSTLVSNPISIPTSDNRILEISSVSLEVNHQVPDGTECKYYVASDLDTYNSIYDFNWIPITPVNLGGRNSEKFVNLTSSTFTTKVIDSTGADYNLIPLMSELDSALSSENNPVRIPYTDFSSYRVCRIDSSEKIVKPTLFSGIDTFVHYGKIHPQSFNEVDFYNNLDYWIEEISDKNNISLIKENIKDQVLRTSTPLTSQSSGLFSTNIMCDRPINVTHKMLKSVPDYNLSVYLNGVMISDLPTGTKSDDVEWDFVSGINSIDILYDKPINGYVFFNLISGGSISEYGTVFSDYFSYVDPIEYRRRGSESKKLFTIQESFGRRELVATKHINSRSVLRFYGDPDQIIDAVRYRVDLLRYSNPLQSPSINSVKIRFKHTDK